MAYVVLPVPQPVLDAPSLGTIQFHPSLLPYHRGPSSINWAIAKGASQAGLTVFWPDEGLDEGPVLLQKTCAIGPNETTGDVYFKRLLPMGVDAMLESLDLIKAGVVLKHAQDLAAGSYETWFTKSVAEIPWDRPVSDILNTIRAADPAPGAWTTFRGTRVDMFGASRVEQAGRPGEVLALSDEGIVIAGGAGSIVARRLRIEPTEKVSALEIAHRLGLDVGVRFDWSNGASLPSGRPWGTKP
jgi:methionyl-tRNA formyltransferase